MAERFSNIVSSEELVARIIFSPSYIYQGRVAPTAFRWEILPSGNVEDYISVLRGCSDKTEEETRSFRPRIDGDTRFGYALLNVGEIRNIRSFTESNTVVADVLAYPSKKFPSHAGVVADIDGKRVTALTPITPELMMLQKKLAQLCSEIVKF